MSILIKPKRNKPFGVLKGSELIRWMAQSGIDVHTGRPNEYKVEYKYLGTRKHHDFEFDMVSSDDLYVEGNIIQVTLHGDECYIWFSKEEIKNICSRLRADGVEADRLNPMEFSYLQQSVDELECLAIKNRGNNLNREIW